MKKKEHPFEHILNVHTFNRTETPTKKQLKREERWARDRAEKGYCRYDLGDIDLWFTAVIVNMLCDFKKEHTGFPPIFLDQEYAENRELYPLIKDEEDLVVHDGDEAKNAMKQVLEERANARWEAILSEMADRFERLMGLSENHDPRLEEETEAAFALFAKWFHCLWT